MDNIFDQLFNSFQPAKLRYLTQFHTPKGKQSVSAGLLCCQCPGLVEIVEQDQGPPPLLKQNLLFFQHHLVAPLTVTSQLVTAEI